MLCGCGFHLRGEWQLDPHFRKIYLDSGSPYGQLSRDLRQQLKASNALPVTDRKKATIVLHIEQDSVDQTLLGLNATQQTQQYKLTLTIRFSLEDNNGLILLPAQTVQSSRIITIQASQILGSSNEISLFTQQMRQELAYAILNRLESPEIADIIKSHFKQTKTSVS